jgi:hypothetical protein
MSKNELLVIALFLNTMLLAFGMILTTIHPLGWGVLLLGSIFWGILIVKITK